MEGISLCSSQQGICKPEVVLDGIDEASLAHVPFSVRLG